MSRHKMAIVLLLVSSLATVGFLVWYGQHTDAAIAKDQQLHAEQIAQMDETLKELREKKIAEAQAAAAKEAAEQSVTSGVSGAEIIDPAACNTATTHKDPSAIDVVVNKKHCIQPLTYIPANLVTSNGATLNSVAIDAFNQLFLAAAAAGQPFYVTSSYRSYENQITTYNYWVGVSGKDGADTYSARPGYSEHQTGLAFDVAASGCALDCFGSTSQYLWFQEHAAAYGFVQRYYSGYESITGYKAEEWHYRYVGKTVAESMQAKGVKTLEQYWNISGGDY